MGGPRARGTRQAARSRSLMPRNRWVLPISHLWLIPLVPADQHPVGGGLADPPRVVLDILQLLVARPAAADDGDRRDEMPLAWVATSQAARNQVRRPRWLRCRTVP